MLAVFGGEEKVLLLKEAGRNNSVYFMTAKACRVYSDARLTISCKRVFRGSSTRTITRRRSSNGAVAFFMFITAVTEKTKVLVLLFLSMTILESFPWPNEVNQPQTCYECSISESLAHFLLIPLYFYFFWGGGFFVLSDQQLHLLRAR